MKNKYIVFYNEYNPLFIILVRTGDVYVYYYKLLFTILEEPRSCLSESAGALSI